MTTYERVSNICDLNGINIREKDLLSQIDSLQYMSIVVSLENEFKIEFPDEVLMRNCLENIDEMCKIIEKQAIINEEKNNNNDLEEIISALNNLECSKDKINRAISENDEATLNNIFDNFTTQ